MTDIRKGVPLLEQLQRVPKDARVWREHSSTHHEHYPVGRLCAEAATTITCLEDEKAEERRQRQLADDTLLKAQNNALGFMHERD